MSIPELEARLPPAQPCPWRDERGAVLVLGVFMGACMVGLLWYLAGIGDAIIHRERLQEAADAAAFSSAALHARGMNMVVLVNLIMACILGVRVTLKAVELGLGIALIFCTLVPPFEPLAAVCAEGIEAVQSAINATRAPINQTLSALSKSQKAFAALVPGAAAVGSGQVGARYRPLVKSAVAASPQSLRGLPVAEDSIDHLCAEAGQSVMGLLEMALPDGLRAPATRTVFDKIQGVVGKVVASGGAFFCELGSGAGAPPDLGAETQELAEQGCSREQEQRQRKGDKSKFDLDQCRRDKQSEAQRRVQPGKPSSVGSGAGMTPKKLSPGWQNGVDAAQLTSLALGSGGSLRAGSDGVRAGAWSQAPAPSGTASAEQGFAQAEFFFDCAGRWSSASCTGPGTSELALWHFRWRARLRRCNTGFSALAQVEGSASLLRAALSGSSDVNPRLGRELERAAQQGVIH
jgi:hypothetical protein